ncbi:MAG: riboflavin synthase [Actinomycetota bacterium]
MFTGLIEQVGKVNAATSLSLEVLTRLELHQGDSIAVNGVCLTVASVGPNSFQADLSEETVSRTNLARLEPGVVVNLERALRANGRFGGHVVQGHVDGVVTLVQRRALPGSTDMWFEISGSLERYLVEKGSVTLDGVSLTVSAITEGQFACSFIPHTLESTTFGNLQIHDVVNLEVDVLAKYVERLHSQHMYSATLQPGTKVT